MVLTWTDEVEQCEWLSEFFEDVIVDSRLAPGKILLFSPPPLLPLDLNVLSRA